MTFLDVLNLWGKPHELAADLGIKLSRVQKWRVRRSIPSESWPQLIEAAQRRGFSLTAEMLLRASAARSESRCESRMVA